MSDPVVSALLAGSGDGPVESELELTDSSGRGSDEDVAGSVVASDFTG
ncbi:hypothetical protein [Demequina flava]|nr:hypothetical protein [Demequina flava]